MNIIRAIWKGGTYLLRHFRLWLGLYLFNVSFALFLVLPLFKLMNSQLSHSLVLEKILADFDYNILKDFYNEHSDALSLISGQALYSNAVYLLLFVFFTGGILEIYRFGANPFRLYNFWSGCSRYFWRLLRLTLYFLVIQAALLSIFGLLFLSPFSEEFSEWPTDVEIFRSFQVLGLIYLLFASFLFMVQDYAKIHLVHEDPVWLFRTFWQSFRFCFNNFSRVYPLYVLNGMLFMILVVIYWYWVKNVPISSSPVLLLMLITGQAFVFARLGSKLLNLASATVMYQAIRQRAGTELKPPITDQPEVEEKDQGLESNRIA